MLTTERMSQVESRCDTTRDGRCESQVESHVPRPDQTRPEVFYRTCLVYLQDLHLQRHLGDVSPLTTAGAGL